MSCNILAHEVYNTPPLIDAQHPPHESLLGLIGSVLLKHNMEQDLTALLLHRDFDLQSDEFMLHDGQSCQPSARSKLQESERVGVASMFYGPDGWNAFEYTKETRIRSLTKDFMDDVAHCLEENDIAGRIVLGVLEHPVQGMMEYTDMAGRQLNCEIVPWGTVSESEATEWAFGRAGDNHEYGTATCSIVYRIRGCARTTTNDHKKK